MDDLYRIILNNLSIIFKSEKNVLLGFNDFNVYHNQVFYQNSSEDLICIVCCFDNKFNICLILSLNKKKINLGLSILEIEDINHGWPSYIQNKFTKFEIVFGDFVNIYASHNNRGLLKYTLRNIHDSKKKLNVLINEFEEYYNNNCISNTLTYNNIFYEANLHNSEKLYASTGKFLDVIDLNTNKIITNGYEIKKKDKGNLSSIYDNTHKGLSLISENDIKLNNSNTNYIEILADKLNKEAPNLSDEIKKIIKLKKLNFNNETKAKKNNIFSDYENNFEIGMYVLS